MYHSFLGGVLFLFVYPQQENIIVSFGSVEWNQNPWYFQKAPCHPGVALASHPSTIELSCQVMAWLKLGKLYELYVSNKSHSQWFKIDVLKASSSCEMLEAMMADSLSPQMQKRLGEKLPFNQKKDSSHKLAKISVKIHNVCRSKRLWSENRHMKYCMAVASSSNTIGRAHNQLRNLISMIQGVQIAPNSCSNRCNNTLFLERIQRWTQDHGKAW